MPKFEGIVFLSFGLLLFVISIIGIIINYRNLIRIVICLELAFLSCTLNLVIISICFHELSGYIFGLIILALTGCEVAIGLSLCIVIYRCYTRRKLSKIPHLKS